MGKKIFTTLAFIGIVAGLYWLPAGSVAKGGALAEGVRATQIFVQQNLLYALLPALALAAVVSVSIDRQAVVRSMSSAARRWIAYPVAAVSGSVLSACSCSVLPLFAGIRRVGAGLGPAITFLYAGPAVNLLATVLTARMLGWQIGMTRIVAAIGIGIVVGAIMGKLFGRSEKPPVAMAETERPPVPPLRRVAVLVALLLAVIVFLTWSPSGFVGVLRCCPGGKTASAIEGEYLGQTDRTLTYRDRSGERQTVDAGLVEQGRLISPFNQTVFEYRYVLAAVAMMLLVLTVLVWFRWEEVRQWLIEAYGLGRQIAPLFIAGVFVSGVLLGRPGREGLVPSAWVVQAVGGNSVLANLAASALGAVMYFATLNEVPVIQGLMNAGMGRGPALAMLLAGPAIPGLLVLAALMGWKRTLVYTLLVITTATLAGTIFGAFWP